MEKELCDRLIDALVSRGGAIIPHKTPVTYDLMEELFAPEEAELACTMPFQAATAETIAQGTGRNVSESAAILESMADKGLVFVHEKGGVPFYRLMSLAPGIYEYQFMSGEVSERAKRLARLFDECTPVAGKGGSAFTAPAFPFSRVLTVEQELESGMKVHPYEKISEYINNAEYVSVSTCYCRHHAALVGKDCDKPKEVCMSLGPGAQFAAARGFGRLISTEEALRVLKLSEESGLVHCSSNTSKYIDFICNCCICHCAILQHHKDMQQNKLAAPSNYVVEVIQEDCDLCETCLERCPMDAFSIVDNRIVRDAQLCIGCGLCVSTCPAEVLKMVSRPEPQIPPEGQRELYAAMAASVKKGEAAN
jgi:electron transport complex protein RnfB